MIGGQREPAIVVGERVLEAAERKQDIAAVVEHVNVETATGDQRVVGRKRLARSAPARQGCWRD